MLSEYAREYLGLLKVLTLPDNGYDIRRVPRNINVGWKAATSAIPTPDFFMISGDDCTYPDDYVEAIMQRMTSQPRIVVSSGRPSAGGETSREHSPSGSGRIVNCSFWREVGGKYPMQAGWETWLLYKALEKGFEVRLFGDLVFQHLRPRGEKHQFAYWGAAMCTLGYHPLYAAGRIAKNLVTQKVAVKGSLNMLRGYIEAHLGSSDPFMRPFESSLRRFVHTEQVRHIARLLATPLAAIKLS
jgi:hypothetical protein